MVNVKAVLTTVLNVQDLPVSVLDVMLDSLRLIMPVFKIQSINVHMVKVL